MLLPFASILHVPGILVNTPVLYTVKLVYRPGWRVDVHCSVNVGRGIVKSMYGMEYACICTSKIIDYM